MAEYWQTFLSTVKSMTIFDLIDILIVTVLIYVAYKFLRERRASKLALGVLTLVIVQIISSIFNLRTIGFLMQTLFQVGIIALIIVFQPELRTALEKVGGVRELINPVVTKDSKHITENIETVCNAVCDMSLDKTGALIVFERTTKLGEYISSGTIVNADISANLIKTIFFKNSPLHDGAIIIRDGRIHSAKCMLPLTKNNQIDKEFATRHRAAIGMSENSDAVVVVVSEQTGVISVACKGELKRNYDYRTLYNELVRLLVQTQPAPKDKNGKSAKPGREKSKKTESSDET